MSDALHILVVEDDAPLRDAVCLTLEVAGHTVTGVGDGPAALARADEEAFNLVVSDLKMQPMDGLELLAELRRRLPQLPVLLMTAFGDVEKAVDAMRGGACDFLMKPFEPQVLLEHVRRYAAPDRDPGGMVAADPHTRKLLALAAKVAETDATVLLTGESGTGKEVFARYLHEQSPRRNGPFVAINCAAIPDTLLEATLFGHEKGAFTGAATAQAGKFERAAGGTLLLDEISEMPLGLQAKLLRVLQEREVERVGGKKAIALDIRVLATTNRDMTKEVAAGRFREDLYYRLNVFPLAIPSLRERPGDIVPLAHHFARLHGERLLLAGERRHRAGHTGVPSEERPRAVGEAHGHPLPESVPAGAEPQHRRDVPLRGRTDGPGGAPGRASGIAGELPPCTSRSRRNTEPRFGRTRDRRARA